MRRSAVALAITLIVTLGIAVPAASAAVSPSGEPKVVIIVGATHSATASYRADADRAYAEAIKYTSDVTKVYSPNATWAKVKAAVVGASVVIYMGHGNGWPSPYTYDPNYTTKDGFGLNATAGNGDYNNKYYGEPYVAKLDLAPGAVILLHHLCYASGNSEPGNAEPSASVARQRADNYAAGFLKAGAAAVIADGHTGAEPYLQALFTTHQTLEDMWRTMPDQNGHVRSFASSRTPGATVFQDPNTATTGYYRSLAITSTGVTTDDVILGGIGDTGSDPSTLQVPGNADVAAGGAALFTEAGDNVPDGTLPAGTRLRVVDTAVQTSGEAATLVQVQGIDDPSITGFIAASDLTPRDSTAPIIRSLDSGGPFSPNGDGQVDTAQIRAQFTESVAWTLQVTDDHGILFEQTGQGSAVDVAWDGLVAGAPVADGTYQVHVTGVDAWGNGPAEATRNVKVDTTPPTTTSLTPGASTTQWFSPNGDGFRDTVAVVATDPEPGGVAVKVRDAGGAVVDKWTVGYGSSPVALTWDGRTTAGGYAPDGVYTINAASQDLAGNTGPTVARTVELVAALRSVASSRTMFFPQDLDRLARKTSLSLVLQRPMTVSWAILDATGATVATRFDATPLPAGRQTWTFDGRAADGTMLPRGHYTVQAVATDGTLTATQAVAFDLDAFRLTLSDATPARGQTVSIAITSAEVLSRNPRLFVYQPGVSHWSAATTKTGKYTYKVTIRLKSGGSAGPVRFRVKGYDKYGGRQRTWFTYTLH